MVTGTEILGKFEFVVQPQNRKDIMRLHQGGVLTLVTMCGYPKPNTLYREFVCACASKYSCVRAVNSQVENQLVRKRDKTCQHKCVGSSLQPTQKNKRKGSSSESGS